MAVPFLMPKVEMTQETATVIQWLKQEGEPVEKGEPVLVVETDKVTFDVEAPASGILAGVRAGPRQQVPVTELIAYILEPGESLPAEAGPQAEAPEVKGLDAPSPAATPVAQRMAADLGIDLSGVSGTGPGGRITQADVQAASAARTGAAEREQAANVRATPAARRLARERGIDLAQVPGSGPRARVQAADLLACTPTAPATPSPPAEVIPLEGMRRTIAERLTMSYQNTPHITFTVRVDMGGFEETRAQLNALAEAAGQPRVSVTAVLVRAVAWALRRHPWLNSTLRGEEVHLLREVNVGVAVALPTGLIVPVVRQADRKSVGELAAELHNLVMRAREGQLAPADVTGGTFTISNLGPFGIQQFTAIINPPQAAILAVGSTRREPVVGEGDQVIVRPIMRMTLSVDHRIVDGAVAAQFLADLRRALEAPAALL